MDGAELESHLQRLETDGFTIVPAAIPPALLEPMRNAFERVCDAVRATKPPEHWANELDDAGAVDFFRAYELDASFEPLMDLGAVLPILDAAVRGGRGGSGGGELRLRTPVTQLLPGNTAGGAWHRDGGHIRCTYIFDDLEEGGGGTAVVAGTHLDYLLNVQENFPCRSGSETTGTASRRTCRRSSMRSHHWLACQQARV
jgi:hypothetical protein